MANPAKIISGLSALEKMFSKSQLRELSALDPVAQNAVVRILAQAAPHMEGPLTVLPKASPKTGPLTDLSRRKFMKQAAATIAKQALPGNPFGTAMKLADSAPAPATSKTLIDHLETLLAESNFDSENWTEAHNAIDELANLKFGDYTNLQYEKVAREYLSSIGIKLPRGTNATDYAWAADELIDKIQKHSVYARQGYGDNAWYDAFQLPPAETLLDDIYTPSPAFKALGATPETMKEVVNKIAPRASDSGIYSEKSFHDTVIESRAKWDKLLAEHPEIKRDEFGGSTLNDHWVDPFLEGD